MNLRNTFDSEEDREAAIKADRQARQDAGNEVKERLKSMPEMRAALDEFRDVFGAKLKWIKFSDGVEFGQRRV